MTAATHGGVVRWNRSTRTTEVFTTADGLPTNIILHSLIHPWSGQLLVTTTNGCARQDSLGSWEHIVAGNLERGDAFHSMLALRDGAWIIGGDNGKLLYWKDNTVDSLFVPSLPGRIISLALLADWSFNPLLDTVQGLHASSEAQRAHKATALFPVGLCAVTDNDGVWILTLKDLNVSWTHLNENDALPSRFIQAATTDSLGDLWLATLGGIARVQASGLVETWPADPILRQPAQTLFLAPSKHVYVGLPDGLGRIDPQTNPPHAELTPWGSGRITSITWNDEGLWWTDGQIIQSFLGVQLQVPLGLANSYGFDVCAQGDTVWVSHAFGKLSSYANGQWENYGQAAGLPSGDLLSLQFFDSRLFIGSTADLFVQQDLVGPLRFYAWDEGPPGLLRAQTVHADSHWVGGSEGLWKQSLFGWEEIRLPLSSLNVQGLLSSTEGLWATLGYNGVAVWDGHEWNYPLQEPSTAGRYFSSLARAINGQIALGTNLGVALWDKGIIRILPGGPNEPVTALTWWDDTLAVGTFSGLWLWHTEKGWEHFGILDGLPGTMIRSLTVDRRDNLWVASTRGVGWLPPAVDPPSRGRDYPKEYTLGKSYRLLPTRKTPRGLWMELPANSRAQHLDLFDVRGRLFRRLEINGIKAFWDGRDNTGASVPRGLYWARMVSEHHAPIVRRVLYAR